MAKKPNNNGNNKKGKVTFRSKKRPRTDCCDPKPSRSPEDSAPEIGKKEYSEIIAKHGQSAYNHYYDGLDGGRFAIGSDGRAARKELLGTKKRVPNDTFVARSLSKFLRGKGIKDVSPSTVYDWMRADETREALGGKHKGPKISISHYVAVSRNAISMKQRREFLLEAIHNGLTAKELEARVRGTIEDYVEPGNAAVTDHAELDGLERSLNQARSILTNTFVSYDTSKSDDSAQWTIGSLENLAIYIWQFRDDLEGGTKGRDS